MADSAEAEIWRGGDEPSKGHLSLGMSFPGLEMPPQRSWVRMAQAGAWQQCLGDKGAVTRGVNPQKVAPQR